MSHVPATITRIEIRRESDLRSHMYDFMQLLAPQWNRQAIDQASRAGKAHPRQITLAS